MEIEKLHKMLTEAGIDHEWLDRTPPGYKKVYEKLPDLFEDIPWGWQVIVYKENGDRLVSAIEGYGSYGYGLHGEQGDLIEIMGLLTPEEREFDSVAGFLTAEDVFARIERAVRC